MKTLIETKRLLLREITVNDKEDMLKMYSNPEVQKYTGEPIIESLDEMEAAIQQRAKDYKKYGYGRWATILKQDMEFIGWAGLAYLWEFDEIDLGYRFLPKYWGMGYATEASLAILKYGFEILEIKSIVAIAMKENTASIRVMEKVGMEFEKIAPYELGSEDAIWYRCDKSLLTKQKEE